MTTPLPLRGDLLPVSDLIPKERHMDPSRRMRIEAWARSRFSPDALCTLRVAIRTQEARLHELGASVTPEAVVDAVLAAAATDAALAAALQRATQMDIERKRQRPLDTRSADVERVGPPGDRR